MRPNRATRWLKTAVTHRNLALDLLGGGPGIVGLILFVLGKMGVVTSAAVADLSAWVAAVGLGLVVVARAVLASYWIERAARLDAEQQRDTLLASVRAGPRPTFQLRRQDGDYLLVVGNDGPTARFYANLRVTHASVFPSGVGRTFPLLWERAQALDAKIVTGAEDHCRIARVNMPGAVLGSMVDLAMYRFDDRTRCVESFWNTGWLPGQTAEVSAHFEIIVTAEPEIEGGPGRLFFQLGPWALLQPADDGYQVP